MKVYAPLSLTIIILLVLSACGGVPSSAEQAAAPTTGQATMSAATRTPLPRPRRTTTPRPPSTPRPTRTPKPSATPISVATDTPVVDQRALDIAARLEGEVFDIPLHVSTNNETVTIDLFAKQPISVLQEDLQRIPLLNQLESYAYLTIYTILHDFAAVTVLTVRCYVDDRLVYEVTTNRSQAYDFPDAGLSASMDPFILASSAPALRMSRIFNPTFHAEDLQGAVTHPEPRDIQDELENWISGQDALQVAREDTSILVDVDISTATAMMFPSNERTTTDAQAWIDDRSRMNTISVIGALMDRFPTTGSVTVRILLDGVSIMSYQCTREQFSAIGSHTFIMASTLAEMSSIQAQMTKIE